MFLATRDLAFFATFSPEAFDLNRFTLRLTHLTTVGAMLVFFGVYQQRFSAEVLRLAAGWPTTRPEAEIGPLPVREALEYAAGVFNAPRALLLRDDPMEPWVHVAEWRGLAAGTTRLTGWVPG